jgi:ABC-type amino acid transport substrate-binding protein
MRQPQFAARPKVLGHIVWSTAKSLAPFGVVVLLLAAVNFLPPDTSLREVMRHGVLRVCVPDEFPPLVTRDAGAPGLDIEILRSIASDMGIRLALVRNSSIGRDFNPRNWRVTRAQCQVVAGGVIASPATRSFLETTRPHLQTGWAAIAPRDDVQLLGSTIGFFAGVSGLDRIALSRYLREQGASVRVVNDSSAMIDGLRTGAFAAGVTESLAARQIASTLDADVMWLPQELGRHPVAFGLWKGDLTLKRRIERKLAALAASGQLEALIEQYGIAPIDDVCAICR